MPSVLCRVDRPSRNLRQAGFSLVELMVVITIIGILAGIAVPRFQTFRARSQQAEAKSGLNGLYLSMQAYQANYNEFPTTNEVPTSLFSSAPQRAIDRVGFRVGGNNPRYGYALSTNRGGWAAYAISFDPLLAANHDYLRINTNKVVCAPFDSVTGVAPAAATTTQDLPTGNNCHERVANATNPNSRPTAFSTRDCALGQTVNNCITLP